VVTGVPADGVIPSVADLCASFQHAVTRHLCHRVQRAMEYVDGENMMPLNHRYLVVITTFTTNTIGC